MVEETGLERIRRTFTDRDVKRMRKELEQLGIETRDDATSAVIPISSDVGFVVDFGDISVLAFTRANQRANDVKASLNFFLAVLGKNKTPWAEEKKDSLRKLGIKLVEQSHPKYARVQGLNKKHPWEEIKARLIQINELARGAAKNAAKKPKAETKANSADEANRPDAEDGDDYVPKGVDSRKRAYRQIAQRRGQTKFRKALIERFEGRCAVTGCRILDLLEAAHINPYRSDDENNPKNGLLLRTDIHTLFDLHLFAIHPETLRIEIHPDVAKDQTYAELADKPLRCPKGRQPSGVALQSQYDLFCEQRTA